VTKASGDTSATDSGFAHDWAAVRGDTDLQFTPLNMPKVPHAPDWLEALGRFLRRLLAPIGEALTALGRMIGLSGTAVAWAAGALVAALLLYLLWRMLPARKPRATPLESPGWTPAEGEARALLEDADQLAAQGRFDEATHLLLRRSVQQIAAERPGLIEVSSTAREIAALPALSPPARTAFGVMADRVERSLFALRGLSAEDWSAARAAYADFALATGASR
jgi:hypothetical protein